MKIRDDMKRFVFVPLLAFMCICYAKAQMLPVVIDEQALQFKVKQIDEFFRRFNYETDYKGDAVSAQGEPLVTDSVAESGGSDAQSLKRKNLMTLFDFEKFGRKNMSLDSLATEFLDYVMRVDAKIHYGDTIWCAEAISSITFGGKAYPMHLWLSTERIEGNYFKWVISMVESPLFKCLADSFNTKVMILPNAHGTSFMSLPEDMNLNAKSVRAMFSKGYVPNPLAVLDWILASGRGKIGKVSNVIYHFRLPEYSFSVERHENRNSYNKGWLISEIVKLKRD